MNHLHGSMRDHVINARCDYLRFDFSFPWFGTQRGRGHCNLTKRNIIYETKAIILTTGIFLMTTHRCHVKLP